MGIKTSENQELQTDSVLENENVITGSSDDNGGELNDPDSNVAEEDKDDNAETLDTNISNDQVDGKSGEINV